MPEGREGGITPSSPRITRGPSAVWVGNDITTARIDPASNRVAARIPIPAWSGIAAGAGGWAADAQAIAVYRIDLYASG
jgi:hypothetical protein